MYTHVISWNTPGREGRGGDEVLHDRWETHSCNFQQRVWRASRFRCICSVGPYIARASQPFRALYTLRDGMTLLTAAFRLRHECATFDRKAAMLFSLRLSNVTAICPPPLVQQVTCTLPACNSAIDVTCTTNGFNTPRAYSWTHRSSADARAEIVPRDDEVQCSSVG